MSCLSAATWRSIVSNRWRVAQDFSASCNKNLSSVERVCSSTPGSNGLKRFGFALGMKLSTGRPSYGPSPRLLCTHAVRFYKFVLLVRSTSCTAFGRCEQELNRENSLNGIRKCTNSPQVVHSELLFFFRGANSIRTRPKRTSVSPKQQAQTLL